MPSSAAGRRRVPARMPPPPAPRHNGSCASSLCVFVTAQVFVCVVCVCGLWDRCVFYYCRTYYKAVRVGGRRRVEDMCYERRRAEACVDESAHHALGPVRNPVL